MQHATLLLSTEQFGKGLPPGLAGHWSREWLPRQSRHRVQAFAFSTTLVLSSKLRFLNVVQTDSLLP